MNERDIELRFLAGQSIVREAGHEAARLYRSRDLLTMERKGPQDLVSEADRGCEDLIVGALHRLFSEDSFVGEERGFQQFGSELTWVIDPIDGTANFLRGIPIWCVSLGLVSGTEVLAGIIYNPITDELYAARRGGGAKLNGEPIQVSSVSALSDARIGIGFSYRRPIAPHVGAIAALLEAHCEYSRLGSGALGMALTADGRLDGYWEAHINIWDVAAGLCLVSEAKGWTSSFMTPDAFAHGNPILATTPLLRDRLQSLLEPFSEFTVHAASGARP